MEIPTEGVKPEYEAYYLEESKDYIYKTPEGAYRRVDKTQLKSKLRKLGFNHLPVGNERPEIEDEVEYIIENKALAFAGPLAGHRAGLMKLQNNLILVTVNPCPMEAIEGEWPDLEKYLEGLFGEEQIDYFFGWIKVAYEAVRTCKPRPGQLLALAGESGGGKSMLQTLIGHILGRSAKPFLYLSGQTTFNSDLFGAEHQVIGDELSQIDTRTRRTIGNKLKQIVAEPMHKYHKKGKDGFDLYPFWRCTISFNHDGENVRILPTMDESMLDKIMLFECYKKEFELPPGMATPWDGYLELLIDQLPHMLHWLLKAEIPESIADKRYGVKAFHNRHILDRLDDHAPEENLWGLVEEILFAKGNPVRSTITSTQLTQMIIENNAMARNLLHYDAVCGVYLSRIAAKKDGRVEKAKGRSLWNLVSESEIQRLKDVCDE